MPAVPTITKNHISVSLSTVGTYLCIIVKEVMDSLNVPEILNNMYTPLTLLERDKRVCITQDNPRSGTPNV
jgi:hypothetical protein